MHAFPRILWWHFRNLKNYNYLKLTENKKTSCFPGIFSKPALKFEMQVQDGFTFESIGGPFIEVRNTPFDMTCFMYYQKRVQRQAAKLRLLGSADHR